MLVSEVGPDEEPIALNHCAIEGAIVVEVTARSTVRTEDLARIFLISRDLPGYGLPNGLAQIFLVSSRSQIDDVRINKREEMLISQPGSPNQGIRDAQGLRELSVNTGDSELKVSRARNAAHATADRQIRNVPRDTRTKPLEQAEPRVDARIPQRALRQEPRLATYLEPVPKPLAEP